MSQESPSYRDAGVAVVDRIKPLAKETMPNGVLMGGDIYVRTNSAHKTATV